MSSRPGVTGNWLLIECVDHGVWFFRRRGYRRTPLKGHGLSHACLPMRATLRTRDLSEHRLSLNKLGEQHIPQHTSSSQTRAAMSAFSSRGTVLARVDQAQARTLGPGAVSCERRVGDLKSRQARRESPVVASHDQDLQRCTVRFEARPFRTRAQRIDDIRQYSVAARLLRTTTRHVLAPRLVARQPLARSRTKRQQARV